MDIADNITMPPRRKARKAAKKAAAKRQEAIPAQNELRETMVESTEVVWSDGSDSDSAFEDDSDSGYEEVRDRWNHIHGVSGEDFYHTSHFSTLFYPKYLYNSLNSRILNIVVLKYVLFELFISLYTQYSFEYEN